MSIKLGSAGLTDHGRNALNTTAAGETADGGLGDALDVVAEDLAVTLGAGVELVESSSGTSDRDSPALAEAFAALTPLN